MSRNAPNRRVRVVSFYFLFFSFCSVFDVCSKSCTRYLRTTVVHATSNKLPLQTIVFRYAPCGAKPTREPNTSDSEIVVMLMPFLRRSAHRDVANDTPVNLSCKGIAESVGTLPHERVRRGRWGFHLQRLVADRGLRAGLSMEIAWKLTPLPRGPTAQLVLVLSTTKRRC